MSEQELSGTTALVTGASRRFGRGIATAVSRVGAHVVGVARDPGPLQQLAAELDGSFTALAAGPGYQEAAYLLSAAGLRPLT